MHELSLMAQVFEIIKETKDKYCLEKITRVELKVGELTCVEKSALEFAFSAFAASNNLVDSKLKIDLVKARAKCANCNLAFRVKWEDRVCPNCNSYCQQLLSGEELYLNKIEGE